MCNRLTRSDSLAALTSVQVTRLLPSVDDLLISISTFKRIAALEGSSATVYIAPKPFSSEGAQPGPQHLLPTAAG